MIVFPKSFFMLDDRVKCETYSSDETARYNLVGERFQQNNEILKLLSKYNGACTEVHAPYATAHPCSLNCTQCERSIYHIIREKEKFFTFQCNQLCERHPRKNDTWEVSLVYKASIENQPRYEDYYYTALTNIDDRSILDIIYQMMIDIDPTVPNQIQFCYIKIKRFDSERAYDVSSVANERIQRRLLEDFNNGNVKL